jgi:hypothetical protein
MKKLLLIGALLYIPMHANEYTITSSICLYGKLYTLQRKQQPEISTISAIAWNKHPYPVDNLNPLEQTSIKFSPEHMPSSRELSALCDQLVHKSPRGLVCMEQNEEEYQKHRQLFEDVGWLCINRHEHYDEPAYISRYLPKG